MRKRAISSLENLKLSETCRAIGDRLSEGIILLKGGVIEYANSAFAEMAGLPMRELEGSDINLILKSLSQEDAESFTKAMSSLKNRESASLDLRLVKSDRKVVSLRLDFVRLSDERTAVIFRETTDFALLAVRAKESEMLYKNLVERARLGILIVQGEQIIYANPSVSRISGYKLSEIVGANFTDFLAGEDKEKVRRLYYQRLASESVLSHYELRLPHKKGRELFIEVDVSLIEHKGAPATLVVLNDISERKKVEEDLKKTLKKLRQAFGGTILALARVAEMKDPYTAGHQNRVADLARSIAKTLGLSADQIDGLRLAASIHDIGKVVLPAEILSKPGKLSEHEWNLIRTHPQMGYEILKDICFPWPIADIILQHHERLDGSGYPFGLKGHDICVEARILAVADVVEAMSSHRPYRSAFSIDEALKEIIENKGKLFDERVVDACVFLFKEKGYRFK